MEDFCLPLIKRFFMKKFRNFFLGAVIVSSSFSFATVCEDFLTQKKAEIQRKEQELYKLKRGETQSERKQVYETYLREAELDLNILKKEGALIGKEMHHVNRVKFENLGNISEKTLAGQQKLKRVEVKTKAMQKVIQEMSVKVNKQITFLINDMTKKSGKTPLDQAKLDRIIHTISFFR
jgi:S-adenosylhomocysteine hydrolase